MLINKDSICNYIPQRFPFVMIDELVAASETGFESRFEILDSNIFLKDTILSESALIENIAQTCAAGFGYLGAQNGEEAGKLGFIGAVSKLEVSGHANSGDVVETKIEVLSTFDTIHLIEGTAFLNGNPLVSCQMKIVVG